MSFIFNTLSVLQQSIMMNYKLTFFYNYKFLTRSIHNIITIIFIILSLLSFLFLRYY